MTPFNLKNKNGIVFTFEIRSFGRGQWAIDLICVDGVTIINGCGDPVYPTARQAKAMAKILVDKLVYYSGLGWCVG